MCLSQGDVPGHRGTAEREAEPNETARSSQVNIIYLSILKYLNESYTHMSFFSRLHIFAPNEQKVIDRPIYF